MTDNNIEGGNNSKFERILSEFISETKSTLAIVIIGILINKGAISAELGVTSILAVLAGNLYPKSALKKE